MTVHHHLDQATILRYASGDLDAAFTLVVASHLAMCDSCRAEVRRAEEIGGNLLEETATTDLGDLAFEGTMERIMAGGRMAAPAPRPIAEEGDVPVPLRHHIGASLDSIRWRAVAPGIGKRAIALDHDDGSSLFMLKIAPGMALPEHGHGGGEMTLILSGAYNDSFGRFGPGDVADLDEHVEHQPIVEDGAPCICLVATESPTRFKKLVNRLFQPIIGI